MSIRLVHLLPDLLNLYGDYANLLVLRRALTAMGAEADIVPYTGETEAPLTGATLLYAGPGTERRITFALERLYSARERLNEARQAGAFFLFCGSAVELPAQEIVLPDGKSLPGLALAPYTIRRTDDRQLGDCLMESDWSEKPAVGFLNKSGYMQHAARAPFHLKLGEGGVLDAAGNATQAEGYADDTLLATYCIGPLLVKNPWLCRRLAGILFANALPGQTPRHVPNGIADTAYQVTVAALIKRENL